MTLTDSICEVCNEIYNQLGPSHNECVYQKALILELYNIGATSVEFEKHVPVFFKDSLGVTHTIGDERIDILARFESHKLYVLIELKAVATRNRLGSHLEQLKKYKKSLQELNITPNILMLINFPQGNDIKDNCEILVYDSNMNAIISTER